MIKIRKLFFNMPLFNIFSKKEKKNSKAEPKQKPKIICDIHEKNSLVLANLTELGAEIELMPLKVGDYLINNIAIERKTTSDFINSMLSKRLQEQLNQIQQYEKKILILEGSLNQNQGEFKIHPNAIKGQILAILTHHNIPIIFTENSEDTAIYLFLLAKQQLKGVPESTLHQRIPKTRKEQQQYILESFPGIGPKTAKKLLKEFKSLSGIFNAAEEALRKILKSKAEDFRQLLE